MGKGVHGRSKADKAFDQIQRDIRDIKFKERKGIVHENAVTRALNPKKVKLKDRQTDAGLTSHIADGYDRKSDPDSAYTRAQERREFEKEIKFLSKKYDIPIDALRKNPNLRPVNAAEIDAAWEAEEQRKAEEKAAKKEKRTRKKKADKGEKVVLKQNDDSIDLENLED